MFRGLKNSVSGLTSDSSFGFACDGPETIPSLEESKPKFMSLSKCAGCMIAVAPFLLVELICEECTKDIPNGLQRAKEYRKTVRPYSEVLKEKGLTHAN